MGPTMPMGPAEIDGLEETIPIMLVKNRPASVPVGKMSRELYCQNSDEIEKKYRFQEKIYQIS